jgi:energy-coupling factor transport system ATP-binding protein
MSIIIENLTYIYMQGSPFESVALDDISLEIQDGEFVGLIGHTGSGKSTLVQHLNGLLKATKGRLRIDHIDLSDRGRNLKELRQHVGLVFQYPEHQLFEETVYQDIAFGPKNLNLDPDEIYRRVKEAMELVGLDYEDLKERSPFEISGGQRRRVAIAGVLAMKPKVLILDEPTAGLDPRGRDEILGQIKELHRRYGMTIILVSHSMKAYGEESLGLAEQLLLPYNRTSIALIRALGSENIIKKATQLIFRHGGPPQWTVADYTVDNNKQAIVLILNDIEKRVCISEYYEFAQYRYTTKNDTVIICLDVQKQFYAQKYPDCQVATVTLDRLIGEGGCSAVGYSQQ